MSRLVVDADLGEHTISRHVYGHFAEHLGRCIYDGVWVGEDSPIPNTRGMRTDIVEALRALDMPNLRWPGGCFADEYHWMDGVGPRDQRPAMLNTHWGGVTEDNSFGTHEFLDLCEQLECEPYICGNVGSGTVREMQQWIEYITFGGRSPMADLRRANGREEPWRVRFWGVGNENWGCGGNMRPEYYADLYRQYATYCRDLSGNQLYRVACGSNGSNYRWTEVLMREVFVPKPGLMQAMAMHYYCGSGAKSRSATVFDEQDWFALLKRAARMDELVRSHTAIMDQYDPDAKVGLLVDEWGAWHDVEPGTNPRFLYQQNSLRDALVAGITLNILNSHCRRVRMANIAQTINVLQAMVLTEGERMALTPTYHVYHMYRGHHDATLLPTALSCPDYECGSTMPALSASASRSADGSVYVTVCNVDPNTDITLTCDMRGMQPGEVTGTVLTADVITGHNTFDEPGRVTPRALPTPDVDRNVVTVTLPSKSVVALWVAAAT